MADGSFISAQQFEGVRPLVSLVYNSMTKSDQKYRKKLKVKVLPTPNMAHRAAPISVSITLGHTSAKMQ